MEQKNTLNDIKEVIIGILKGNPMQSVFMIKQNASLENISENAIDSCLQELWKQGKIQESGNCYYLNPETII